MNRLKRFNSNKVILLPQYHALPFIILLHVQFHAPHLLFAFLQCYTPHEQDGGEKTGSDRKEDGDVNDGEKTGSDRKEDDHENDGAKTGSDGK